MKRTVTLLLALVLLLSIPMVCLADGAQWTGEVIAKQITFRSGPKSNAKSIGSIKNGATVTILDDSHSGWFHIQYDGKEGYVMDEYVVENADHMILLSSMPVYAFPHSEKRVGSLASYTRLTIIDEYDGYYVVNLREASGFIRKRNADILLDSDIASARPVGKIRMNAHTQPRTGPSSKYELAVREVNEGEVFEYVDKVDDWYIFILDGHYAFMWNGCCSEV